MGREGLRRNPFVNQVFSVITRIRNLSRCTSRNPFVNQVFSVPRLIYKKENLQMSQSLRKSGLFRHEKSSLTSRMAVRVAIPS